MMNIDEIRKKLKDRNLKVVASHVKVHPNCLYRFVNGITDPRASTMQKLQQYLSSQS